MDKFTTAVPSQLSILFIVGTFLRELFLKTRVMACLRERRMCGAGGLTSRDRPDSFVDLVYSLHQAVSSQMGSHSSKDVRSGATLATAATASSQQGHGPHRQKKSSSRV